MGRAEFIALSASVMILTALGIDIMLPAFAEVRRHFHLAPGSTETSFIIAAFFLGQVAQIAFGTVSDSWGRLAIVRVGFPLYIAGGLAAGLAPDLPTMYLARTVVVPPSVRCSVTVAPLGSTSTSTAVSP